jgi:hypothetical protein
MTEDYEGIDFDKEAENLDEGAEWFKPETGKTEITFLSNGRQETREGFEDEDEEREVVVFEIEVDGEEKLWSVNKATTTSSLYGQIVQFATQECDGDLNGQTMTLKKTGSDLNTNYIVVEVV